MSRNAPPLAPQNKLSFEGSVAWHPKRRLRRRRYFPVLNSIFLSPSSTRAIFRSKHSTQNVISGLPKFCRTFTRIEGVLLAGTLCLRNFMGNHTCKFPLSRVATLGENTWLPWFEQVLSKTLQRKLHFMKNHSKSWIWPEEATQPLCTVLSKEFVKMNLPHFGKFLWTLTWKSSGMISSSGLTNEWRN